MQKYFDAHCHVLVAPNIGAICNSAHQKEWERVARLSNPAKNIYSAIGIHPWYINELTDNWRSELRDILLGDSSLLIGEIGLDKHHPDIMGQVDVFVNQLELAHELQRGVCLHCVGVWERIIQILNSFGNKLPPFIIAHEYSGPIDVIKKYAQKYNMYFSYGPRSLKNTSRILCTPIERILSETDSDIPDDVIDIVAKMSAILNVDHEKMADIIYNNTQRMLEQ